MLHSQKKYYYYYSYIGGYLKAVRVIAEIWDSILCFYSSCNQQVNSTYNQCLYIVQTAPNCAASSFCCKTRLTCLDSSLNVLRMMALQLSDMDTFACLPFGIGIIVLINMQSGVKPCLIIAVNKIAIGTFKLSPQ